MQQTKIELAIVVVAQLVEQLLPTPVIGKFNVPRPVLKRIKIKKKRPIIFQKKRKIWKKELIGKKVT